MRKKIRKKIITPPCSPCSCSDGKRVQKTKRKKEDPPSACDKQLDVRIIAYKKRISSRDRVRTELFLYALLFNEVLGIDKTFELLRDEENVKTCGIQKKTEGVEKTVIEIYEV